ncbi:acyltransferase family protein [Paenibacillus sp. GD4]|jgi:acyltransferase|uniref:acyltransferase family protein n=1 Tax=Paenibacillus sp. GD4 TaxID=3068890 RepID=UPI0027968251|nr:acyltransferase family protein [Paenibacillus sp. GD4]MDQ1910394.1 acyltransferase family protein [Paenibacillus sp. GD4]
MDSSNAQGGKRIEWIDTAKGIGIVLVVLAHTSLDFTWIGSFINSFHMPLFFFLSGYLFSMDKYAGFPDFLSRKARTLLLPYFVFACLSYGYFLARYHFGSAEYYQDLNIVQQLVGIVYSAGTREWMDFNLPLWFLTCLFVVEVLFYTMKKAFRSPAALAFVLLICSAAGYADGLWNPVKLPWGADVALTAIVFFGMGHLLKNGYSKLLTMSLTIRIVSTVLFLLINLLIIDQRMNLNMKVHGHYFDFYLGALAGLTGCLLLSSMLRSGLLRYFGNNALLLMALHMPLLNISTKLLSRLPFSASGYKLELLRVLLTLVLASPVMYGINRFFPFLLGRRLRHPFPWKHAAGWFVRATHK